MKNSQQQLKGKWKYIFTSRQNLCSCLKNKEDFLKLTSFILVHASPFALAATARTSVSKMNWTKAFRLVQNISCVLLKEDIIFQAKSNASVQRASDESRSCKKRDKVLHLRKKPPQNPINTAQVYLLPWEQGLSCSRTQAKLGLKEE